MISQQTILPDQSETVSIPRTTDTSAGGSPSALTSPRAGVAKAFSSSSLEAQASSGAKHTRPDRWAGRAPMDTGTSNGAGEAPAPSPAKPSGRRALLQPDL